jgi:hypothetical protein
MERRADGGVTTSQWNANGRDASPTNHTEPMQYSQRALVAAAGLPASIGAGSGSSA